MKILPDLPIMDVELIFLTQLIFSTVGFAIVALWLTGPAMAQLSRRTALMILLVPHAFRHIGLSFLVPGLVTTNIPEGFATAAAYGDLVSAILATIAIVALKAKWIIALPIVWIFSIMGIADLMSALPQVEAVPHFRAAWYIPTYLVPLLIVTHVMILGRLIRRDATSTT